MSIRFYLLAFFTVVAFLFSCQTSQDSKEKKVTDSILSIDTLKIPNDKFGEAVRYGRALMLNTAYYIGPDGLNGKNTGNKMNCTNCHQEAGTKPFSLNLIAVHRNYPQYRAREGRVLSLAERVNNCIVRVHNGTPLLLDSKEMNAFLSYFKWISEAAPQSNQFKGSKNLKIEFPDLAANPDKGEVLYKQECARCHGANGEGVMRNNQVCYLYPPLWGPESYQTGSSMHRIIKQAQWLKANMPKDKASWNKPFLSDQQALDLAAFINNDSIHERRNPLSFNYPNPEEKAIDYAIGPFIDTFSVLQHKFGPYEPIIHYWESKGLKPIY